MAAPTRPYEDLSCIEGPGPDKSGAYRVTSRQEHCRLIVYLCSLGGSCSHCKHRPPEIQPASRLRQVTAGDAVHYICKCMEGSRLKF